MNVIEILKEEEGFSKTVYKDHLGYDTIYYGTKLPISEKEHKIIGEALLKSRLDDAKKELHDNLPGLHVKEKAWDVLYLMAYQLGVPRLMKFKRMIGELREENYLLASSEILDSRFARQVPERANRLAEMMREV